MACAAAAGQSLSSAVVTLISFREPVSLFHGLETAHSINRNMQSPAACFSVPSSSLVMGMLGAQLTAEESELGWEVLRQAAALTASSHGQSSLTTRQLLHGACAGLRCISQEQMDFMVGTKTVQHSVRRWCSGTKFADDF